VDAFVNLEPLVASNGSDFRRTHVRVALLSPYSGNNLGDSAIEDAMVADLRLSDVAHQGRFRGLTRTQYDALSEFIDSNRPASVIGNSSPRFLLSL
jgi:hypothetical protein